MKNCVSQFYYLTLTVKSQKILRTFLIIWWPMPLFLDIYFTYWYRYNMEVDEEKSDTYNILVWVGLWFCRLDVVFFDYFILILLFCRWILEQWGGGGESRGVLRLLRVLHRDQAGPHDLAQATLQHGEKATHTENEIKCRLFYCRKDLIRPATSWRNEETKSRLCLV